APAARSRARLVSSTGLRTSDAERDEPLVAGAGLEPEVAGVAVGRLARICSATALSDRDSPSAKRASGNPSASTTAQPQRPSHFDFRVTRGTKPWQPHVVKC